MDVKKTIIAQLWISRDAQTAKVCRQEKATVAHGDLGRDKLSEVLGKKFRVM